MSSIAFLAASRSSGLVRGFLVPPGLVLDEAPEPQQVKVQLRLEDVVPQGAVGQGLLGLGLQGVVAALHLAQDALDLAHVLFRAFQLDLRLAGTDLVLGDAGRLLEEVAALLGLGREDLVDAALLHHGIGALADARIPEQLPDLLELDRLAVDEVFALSGAVQAPLDGDLGHVQGQRAVFVGDGEGHFGDVEGLAGLRAVEDDVFHASPRAGCGRTARPRPT